MMNCGLFSFTTPRKPSLGRIVPRKLTPRGYLFATLGQFAPRSGRGEILALSNIPWVTYEESYCGGHCGRLFRFYSS